MRQALTAEELTELFTLLENKRFLEEVWDIIADYGVVGETLWFGDIETQHARVFYALKRDDYPQVYRWETQEVEFKGMSNKHIPDLDWLVFWAVQRHYGQGAFELSFRDDGDYPGTGVTLTMEPAER